MAIKKISILSLLAFSVLSASAFAAGQQKKADITSAASSMAVESVNTSSFGEELAKQNENKLLLEAELKAATLRNQIAEQNEEARKHGNADLTSDAKVMAIEGLAGRMSATLVMSDQSKVVVQAGDILPNGLKVKSIEPRKVILLKGKKELALVMQTSAQTSNYGQPAIPGQVAPMPSPMMGSAPALLPR